MDDLVKETARFLSWAKEYFVLDTHDCACSMERFDYDPSLEHLECAEDGWVPPEVQGHTVLCYNRHSDHSKVRDAFHLLLQRKAKLIADVANAIAAFELRLIDVQIDEFLYYLPHPEYFGVATASKSGFGLLVINSGSIFKTPR